MLEGARVFATGVGQLGGQDPIPVPVQGKNITAVGTIYIDGRGNLTSQFDHTIENVGSFVNSTAVGAVTLDHDCRGKLYRLPRCQPD